MKLKKGTRCKIIDCRGKKAKVSIGIYDGNEEMNILNKIRNIPKFKIGKDVIYGFECWWTPIKDLKDDI